MKMNSADVRDTSKIFKDSGKHKLRKKNLNQNLWTHSTISEKGRNNLKKEESILCILKEFLKIYFWKEM